MDTNSLQKGLNFLITSKTLSKNYIAIETATTGLEKEKADRFGVKLNFRLQNSKPLKHDLFKKERKAFLQSELFKKDPFSRIKPETMKQLKTLKVTEFIENKLYYCLNLAESPASMLLNYLHSITIMLFNSNSRKLRIQGRINYSFNENLSVRCNKDNCRVMTFIQT